MRTGTSYMGHHIPSHIEMDIREMVQLGLDDVLLAAQENDFIYFNGKIEFTPKIAADYGLRTIAIFWGVLNLFGGGRSSQYLLEHPEGFQKRRDGSHLPAGCYMNPINIKRIQEMIDLIAGLGFAGYFVDEPTPMWDCFCPSCQAKFIEWYDGDLFSASKDRLAEFRNRCVIDYVEKIATYCKQNHPSLETMCCIMDCDRGVWDQAAKISALDNLGTDLYWVNSDRDVKEMAPIMRDLEILCRQNNKVHHEWLQCWGVQKGREQRILDQGKEIVQSRPDALYVWAWKAQYGTSESCQDPIRAWQMAETVLRLAKEKD